MVGGGMMGFGLLAMLLFIALPILLFIGIVRGRRGGLVRPAAGRLGARAACSASAVGPDAGRNV